MRAAAGAVDDGRVAVVDLDGDGRLDLVGAARTARMRLLGKRRQVAITGRTVRVRAQPVAGDQRINLFRRRRRDRPCDPGLLRQRQLITGPVPRTSGSARAPPSTWRGSSGRTACRRRNSLPPWTTHVVAEQRLKGSCPWVFADDGTGRHFVTDFLWRSPLGLRINAQDTAGVTQTEDWVRIRGDQLAPRDGAYDVRITAELWETHFFDHVSLMVVDHPEDTRT